MKKKSLFAIVGIVLAVALTGCGSASSVNVDESSVALANVEESNGTPESVEVKAEIAAEKWEIALEQSVKFPYHICGFNTLTHGVTVGKTGEIHSTTDGGENWPKSENESNCQFGLDFVSDDIVYSAGNGGDVRKSVDGGKVFEVKTDFLENAGRKVLMLSFLDENVGMIAAIDRIGLTKDGCVTWEEGKVNSYVSGILMKSEQELFYINDKLSLFKTVDRGVNWEETPLNLPLGDDYRGKDRGFIIRLDGDGAYTVFCIQKSTKMLKCYSTNDNCATWTEQEMPEVNGVECLYLNKDKNILTCTCIGKDLPGIVVLNKLQ